MPLQRVIATDNRQEEDDRNGLRNVRRVTVEGDRPVLAARSRGRSNLHHADVVRTVRLRKGGSDEEIFRLGVGHGLDERFGNRCYGARPRSHGQMNATRQQGQPEQKDQLNYDLFQAQHY